MRNSLWYSFLGLFGDFGRTLNKIRFQGRSRAGAANESSLPEELCRLFSLNEIRAATFNFDSKLVIGRGGSGVVYKGFIDDGTLVVAVKRFSAGSSSRETGHEDPFRNEVKLLCQLRHQHLGSLIGFCHEKDEMILVYNYMSKGSLYDYLHAGTGHDPLSWKQRLEICKGAARGLHYLHTGAKRAIIHRDIKSKNILLDDQLIPKLSDFGLSKIGPFSMSNAPIKIKLPPLDEFGSTTKLGGTYGYLDPEFFLNATLVTDKSDVYSFGVVLFEVLYRRKVIKRDAKEDEHFIVPWVFRRIQNGTIYHAIDPYLRGKIYSKSLEKFLEIACRCVHVHGNERPAVGEVEATLELALELQIEADSEMECINPNGECMYEEVLFPSSAFEISRIGADFFGPDGGSDVYSFKTGDTFSDTEDMQCGNNPDGSDGGYLSDSDIEASLGR